MIAALAVSGTASDPLTARKHPESVHVYRQPFQRDRDRVVHARSFRRLAGKTQVFTHRVSDHFRSRLTHTIEVTQIARTVAAALGLNEDLAETLALVHDIGHPPFGHAGERALDDSLQQHGLRFDHNLHALRIVEHFEQRYAAFRGLNLTLGVREGIIKHSRDYTDAKHPELAEYFLALRPPLEAQIIDHADEIAYLTADLDDGVESGILNIDEIRAHVPIFERYYAEMASRYVSCTEKLLFNEALKRMLNSLADDLIRNTAARARDAQVESLSDVRSYPERVSAFSPAVEAARCEAKQYLYRCLYESEHMQRDHQQAQEIVSELFAHWFASPHELPPAHVDQIPAEGLARVIADYIAGMTDQYIIEQWRKLRA